MSCICIASVLCYVFNFLHLPVHAKGNLAFVFVLYLRYGIRYTALAGCWLSLVEFYLEKREHATGANKVKNTINSVFQYFAAILIPNIGLPVHSEDDDGGGH